MFKGLPMYYSPLSLLWGEVFWTSVTVSRTILILHAELKQPCIEVVWLNKLLPLVCADGGAQLRTSPLSHIHACS
jgi:hypothetical protein